MKQLQDRVAIVTGASKGVGKAVARAFAREGAHVVIAARNRSDLEAVAREVAADGGTATAVPTDITVEREIIALFETTRRQLGRLDILVNNAGITVHLPTDQLPLEDWQRVIDTNLTGAFLCSREALKIMKPQRSGRIITVGSISSITPRPDGAAYAATKLALEGLTRSIALDYREHNIGASIIHLGATATSWMKIRPEEATGPDYHLQLDDVGRLVTFMASLPTEANMFETTILPIQQRSFIGRG
ncbi:MAG: SDR family oxidoreductase [Hyphomicrobiales bacterium]|nr:SDR family oxidoreductase [Hyphomicrobiales bacterium]